MENLAQIDTIKRNIRIAPRKAILALYRIIFEEEGDRKNRQKLREFTGFKFNDGSDALADKLRYINQHLSLGDLTSACNILNLDYDGSKAELANRICSSLMDLNTLRSNDDQEVEDGTDDDEQSVVDEQSVADEQSVVSENVVDNPKGKVVNSVPRNLMQQNQPFAFHYKDIEHTIRQFNGEDAYAIESWISEFEDAAILFNWTDIQKVVFAKRTLTGLARLFVQSERGLNSWSTLKIALEKEFGVRINSAQLHEMLTKRKIKPEESVHEYFLRMKDLASKGNIEDDALIHHVIEGIKDESGRKIILYGAHTLTDFKDRLRVYSEIPRKDEKSNWRRAETSSGKADASGRKELRGEKSQQRCYNCGGTGHKSRDCKSKSLGIKCFKCNQFGHIASKCNQSQENRVRNAESTAKVNNIISNKTDEALVTVFVNNNREVALVDTGSEVTLIREDAHRRIGAPMIQNNVISLKGFGSKETKSLGHFQGNLNIEDDDFELKMHVVPDNVMDCAILIGKDIVQQANISITKDGTKISKNNHNVFLTQIQLKPENDVDLSHIEDRNIKAEAEKLIETYVPMKTKTTEVEMTIIVKDERPIYSRPRRLPLPEREIVEQQIEDWIKEGIVEPCTAEYASPVVVVRKKDGSPRVCIDYRKVNEVIVKDRFPAPLIEDQIDELSDARVFSTLDLRNAFFHVAVEKESRKYTAFVTHSGQYCFCKVPFGLCNSPPVFQRFINVVFRPLIKAGILLDYFDDVIIRARDENEALSRLKLVLQTASEYGLSINFKKCQFMKRRVEFLGHVIEDGKVYPSPGKIAAVTRFPPLTSIKSVQSFLGLTGYFRKFIRNYSIIAKPLSDMLKKDVKFKFDTEQEEAFQYLKTALTNDPVLKIYRPEDETEVHTDASKYGYGAVLLQRSKEDEKFHPVHFMSRKTSPAESKYTSYELEALAVIEALRKFRNYLLGITFVIYTDCQAFQKTLNKKDLSAKVARWALLVQEFDCTIKYRPGTKMKHVDALSRHPVMLVKVNDVLYKIKKAQQQDPETQLIREILKEKEYKDYCVKDDILYNFVDGREVLVVPRLMQREIISAAHQRGHFATKRTEELIKQDYYIPDLRRNVEKHISNCVQCILSNRKEGKQEGFLHPLEKESIPLHTYHIDHLGPLDSTSKNYKHLLAVIDSFTKFVWIYPCKTTSAAEVIRKLNNQKDVFGNPKIIITDRGSAFTSQEFADYCSGEGIKHIRITTGLPRSNGQIERVNRSIIPVLTKLSMENSCKWYQHVNRLQTVLNSTYHRSINTTPFELMFGTKMRDRTDLKIQELIDSEIQGQFVEERDSNRRDAKEQIRKVQEENRKTYNLRRREAIRYREGDLVAIKRTQLGPGLKLKPKFIGPYKIKKVKPNNSYDVVRVGGFDGPLTTSTTAEYIKPWTNYDSLSETDNA